MMTDVKILNNILIRAMVHSKIDTSMLKLLLSKKYVIKHIIISNYYYELLEVITNTNDIELFEYIINIKDFIDILFNNIIYIKDLSKDYLRILLNKKSFMLNDLFDVSNYGDIIDYKYIDILESFILSDKLKYVNEICIYTYRDYRPLLLFRKIFNKIIERKDYNTLEQYISKYPLLLSKYFITKYIDLSYDIYKHIMLNSLLNLYEDKLSTIFDEETYKLIYYTLGTIVSVSSILNYDEKVIALEYLDKAGNYPGAESIFSRLINSYSGLHIDTVIKFDIDTMLRLAIMASKKIIHI